jgi:hypothetical protein
MLTLPGRLTLSGRLVLLRKAASTWDDRLFLEESLMGRLILPRIALPWRGCWLALPEKPDYPEMADLTRTACFYVPRKAG